MYDLLNDIGTLAKGLIYSTDQPLFFTQLFFWVFLIVVLFGYSFFYRKPALRNAYLLFVSLYFYYKAGGAFFLILIFSTLVDFVIGQAIHRSHVRSRRRFYLLLSILSNLGILVYFKYGYFLADLLGTIVGRELEVVNFLALFWNSITSSSLDIHTIALPVGVSFFTFQTISYSVDVYRRRVEPVRNLLDFGFYVSFFPQLVAGPIVRAASFIPQLYQSYHLTRREIWHAGFLIMGGLIKKLMFADFLAMHLVDRVFENPAGFTGFQNLMASYGYALQIYFDFSGYTDIAIGVALLLGFKLPINFNSPYKAFSFRDFWRRWHISLSSWLRDYLYIPLGGNRKGEFRAGTHILVTMLLGGLWHGASWQFVLWGLFHGLILVIERWLILIPWWKRGSEAIPRGLKVFFVFHFIWMSWILFRTSGVDQTLLVVQQIATAFHAEVIPAWLSEYWPVALVMVSGFLLVWIPGTWKEHIRGWFIQFPAWFKILLIWVILLVIWQMHATELQPFIYFQF